jgi:DNA-binding HxlR family transcriptional regulator
MTNKDNNAAVQQLLDILESRYAIRVLWALRDGHAQTFRLLQDSVGGVTPNTMNTRLKELRAASLVQHGGEGYQLTATGLDLLKRLSDIGPFAAKWVSAQGKKK